MAYSSHISPKLRVLVIVCRILLAAVFIYSGIGHVLHPSALAENVAAYRILPHSLINVFAIVLPWVELFSALALLAGVLISSSALLIAGLNIVFIAAAISAMARGLNIECGCFSLSNAHDKVGWTLILRDTGLLALCIPVLLASLGKVKKDNGPLVEAAPPKSSPSLVGTDPAIVSSEKRST